MKYLLLLIFITPFIQCAEKHKKQIEPATSAKFRSNYFPLPTLKTKCATIAWPPESPDKDESYVLITSNYEDGEIQQKKIAAIMQSSMFKTMEKLVDDCCTPVE